MRCWGTFMIFGQYSSKFFIGKPFLYPIQICTEHGAHPLPMTHLKGRPCTSYSSDQLKAGQKAVVVVYIPNAWPVVPMTTEQEMWGVCLSPAQSQLYLLLTCYWLAISCHAWPEMIKAFIYYIEVQVSM